ncbi:MAG: Putative glycosyl transferase, family 2 [Leptospirillum sp. Group II 'C75']|uniref:Alpha-L-glycero-D-manno-heptose beta-1,4-glucosyltransferase n=2 Tax=Leptospirillum ferriphilum TaxID=178606 RepID=A0A1V3STG7_9BACT|nr:MULTISPECIES: glycosyltransferase family 2 protein [Leptospirillum]AKS23597.1 alpha-L-glycero-D-manno-heptose beta-1,4-glucosyltransferase [Leptospirillum sp. Group II 'CF-1']EAY56227.1 MAG: putative glycosyl transferase, family 2 [Leptospirillum rubarum]EIJ75521.1 MAG: Putative glycosyl transferase, family 2 [Leptospirillum sp. Group II 'C75']OOH71275.1 alpha-L-glycero-D-manno-heptose beta-1,4-glucosyltransferase [Leptospirillum ferriphilum]
MIAENWGTSRSRRQLSVYILAYNQEHKIRPALESVMWADEVILVDSGSTDKTASIAEELGVKVYQVPFVGFGDLRQKAIDLCQHEWIFSLDSDERMTVEAQKEILEILSSNDPADAYLVPRKNYFLGKWIRFSDWYPDYRQPQLFRQNALCYSQDLVHESYSLNPGYRLGYFQSAIVQIPYYDFSEMIQKMNRYSTLGAEKVISKEGGSGSFLKAILHGVWAFFRHYILKMGCFDGVPGFIIAFYNFESSFYKYMKVYDKRRKKEDFKNSELNRHSL